MINRFVDENYRKCLLNLQNREFSSKCTTINFSLKLNGDNSFAFLQRHSFLAWRHRNRFLGNNNNYDNKIKKGCEIPSGLMLKLAW